MRLKTLAALGLPHEPELEHICTTAALNVFVASVKGGVIELIFLEQIRGICRVALAQDLGMGRQESRTLLRGGQQLVWIPCDRIGTTNGIFRNLQYILGT